MMSLTTELGGKAHNWFPQAGRSWIQLPHMGLGSDGCVQGDSLGVPVFLWNVPRTKAWTEMHSSTQFVIF